MKAVVAETGSERLLVTAVGYEQLCSELQRLRTEVRGELSERLRAARDEDDAADNPALSDLFEEQVRLERRIATLEERVAMAQVVAPAADGIAGIGSCVRVRNVAEGEVGDYELIGVIDPDVGNGRVSVGAPVGRALVGRRAGETVEVKTPRGILAFEVLEVRPARQAA
jgi:transcription elongation factor GreA